MSEQNHPDYDAAPLKHRWNQSLAGLKTAIRTAAFRARGRVAWFVLPHGAIVSMQVDRNAFPHRELRIARSSAPRDPAPASPLNHGVMAWPREVDVLLRYLDAEKWAIVREGLTPTGGIEVVLREVLTIGTSEGPKCARCGEPAQAGPYKEDLCTRCATAAGSEETAARRSAQ